MPPGALMVGLVSTHSRLKAAGWPAMRFAARSVRFNTQPPEGGWVWACPICAAKIAVSTHSRLKAAGFVVQAAAQPGNGFNTQPPEGGWLHQWDTTPIQPRVSTHSRLKAAGRNGRRAGKIK